MKSMNLMKMTLAAALTFGATGALADGWWGGHHGGGHHGGGHHGGGHHGGGHHGGGHHGGGHHGGGHGGGGHQWWSDYYQRWFEKSGYCGQYDYTDYQTCNTGNDYMQCDWNHQSRTCYSAH